MSNRPIACCLNLNGLRCRVRLGWEAQERVQPQWVFFDVAVRFQELPEGCISDRLEGTIGYDALSDWIRELCDSGEFRLIEKLGYQVYLRLRERSRLGRRSGSR